GLLLGSLETGDHCTISVDDFESTAKAERRIGEWKGHLKPIGFFRSHLRPGFTLDATDRTLFARLFPAESRLLLLVHPPDKQGGTAMLFLGQGGQLEADRATVEFPFNLRDLGAEAGPAPQAPPKLIQPPTAVKPGHGGVIWKVGVAGVVVIASVFG